VRLFRIGDATRAELLATLWTGIAFFWVLFAYYLLRPTRETVGSAFGTDLLLGLFTLTFVLITALNQPYLAMVRRLRSSRLAPVVLHAFAFSFVVLAGLFVAVPANLGKVGFDSWLGLGLAFFYSWVTAFSVCGVTLIWVHAVDWFRPDQGQRLFGLISVGGSLGTIAASQVAGDLAKEWSISATLLAAALAVEVALAFWLLSLRACRRMAAERGEDRSHEGALQRAALAAGGFLATVRLVARNPYLSGIAVFVLLSSVSATNYYYLQQGVVGRAFGSDDVGRKQFFADVNLWQNVLSLCIQVFLTSRLLLAFGLAAALCLMPVFSLAGLFTFATWPGVTMIMWIEVGRRMLQFAIDKPAREVLYTPLDAAAKYKAKAQIDTVVLRCGDLLGACASHLLVLGRVRDFQWALLAAPFACVWAALGFWLGRRCRRLIDAKGGAAVARASPSQQGPSHS
jgi:AAA family ATP:ADP antiporter